MALLPILCWCAVKKLLTRSLSIIGTLLKLFSVACQKRIWVFPIRIVLAC